MTEPLPRLTAVQARVVLLLADGARIIWAWEKHSHEIGIPGESGWKRVQQITVFELKSKGMIAGLTITEKGREVAAELKAEQ